MRNFILFSAFAILSLPCLSHAQFTLPDIPDIDFLTKISPPPLAITHVTVIDATGVAAKSDMTVIIKNGHIDKIGKANKVTVPDSAKVVSGKGKFLIPGLWDMHVHWSETDYLPLFVANGVTGIRIMWGQPVHQQWRRSLRNGDWTVPHLSIASPIIDGPKPFWPTSISVKNQAEARKAVDDSVAGGADFIKVYSLLPDDLYKAIVDEAKKLHVSFAGHVPNDVGATAASNAGQKSIEHLTGIIAAISDNPDISKLLTLKYLKDASLADLSHFDIDELKGLVAASQTGRKERADALYALFKKNGTWQVPTLTVLHNFSNFDDPNLKHDARMKYMPRSVKDGWDPSKDFRFQDYKQEDWDRQKKVYVKHLKIVGDMNKAGVDILAGTDVGNPFCFPGFSLHDELGLLVDAGLTPMEALQAATRNAAKYVGRLKSLGTVEEGKIADLILLDADPLADIANTKKIRAVIKGGRLVDRAEIDTMLKKIEKLAAKSKL
ncbi:MAG: amidohydrolase family protein [Acidobacteriota bacterium]